MSAVLWMALVLAGPPTVAPPTATDQARVLTRRSILEYNQGEYVQALADIEHAYELDPRPALLFNVGQCQRALGHHREAALAFKSYLRDVPVSPNRERAATLAAEMEKLARQDEKYHRNEPKPQPEAVVVVAPAPTPVAPPPEPAVTAAPLPAAPEAAVTATEPQHHIRAGAWWLGGAGIAVAVAGTVLFAIAESRWARITRCSRTASPRTSSRPPPSTPRRRRATSARRCGRAAAPCSSPAASSP